jgi:hypothetical protein
VHYYRFIFTTGPKPLVTTGLGVGCENSAVIIPVFTADFKTGGENEVSPSAHNVIITVGPSYGPVVIITLSPLVHFMSRR